MAEYVVLNVRGGNEIELIKLQDLTQYDTRDNYRVLSLRAV